MPALERLGVPADIAELVSFLAGPARWINGQVIYANGGMSLRSAVRVVRTAGHGAGRGVCGQLTSITSCRGRSRINTQLTVPGHPCRALTVQRRSRMGLVQLPD